MLQVLANGLALGAAYALVALGFVLVVNATNAVNFAQGDMVMAGGFVAVALASVLHVPGIVLLPLVLAAMVVIGLLLSAGADFPFRPPPPTPVLVPTIPVAVLLP